GHAVQQVLPHIGANEKVLVLYGDVPLISLSTLQQLLAIPHPYNILTLEMTNPHGYGRIIRNEIKEIVASVEEKDAEPEQKKIKEVNTGVIAINGDLLHKWLPKLENNNAQKEYYLTDLVKFAWQERVPMGSCHPEFAHEVDGVNDRIQQARLERQHQLHVAHQFMRDGLSLIDPARFDLRGELHFGLDCTLDVNVIIEGRVTLGKGVSVGANCILIDCEIGDGVEIRPNSIIEGSKVAEGCIIGPYARLRPGSELAERAHVGNFVEVKKSIIGAGSKANHLTYIGDAEIGKDVNVGAGTITCNYDGVNKSKTIIGDNAFIGSNSSLIAPVTISAGATIGAGSAISKDAPENALTLTRAKQMTISSWKRPEKKK
ncbi:MAG TPA: bifunctional UDP-N-acetylglucosamine diphosphorylase/glucosamine-1-phosphate N-acetyltransferase GlmU, partial [Pseudomonadales bacterium]|nr:bifunctional UDP-N-acetylglucosamine diphosphorylase/glucosamine-1-phosphate N-acetyltransferase GlmU [Pseudomonadales bacterium]